MPLQVNMINYFLAPSKRVLLPVTMVTVPWERTPKLFKEFWTWGLTLIGRKLKRHCGRPGVAGLVEVKNHGRVMGVDALMSLPWPSL